jgi:hypothetical protein
VTGTWEANGGVLRVGWFREAGKPPTAKLKAETRRMGAILGRPLTLEVAIG